MLDGTSELNRHKDKLEELQKNVKINGDLVSEHGKLVDNCSDKIGEIIILAKAFNGKTMTPEELRIAKTLLDEI